MQLYFKRGGAIYADTGAVIKMYASTFESNSAGNVSNYNLFSEIS